MKSTAPPLLLAVVCLVAMPCAVHAAPSPAWSVARADLADGTVVRDVTVTWTDDGAELRLTRNDGSWKSLAPGGLLRAEDAAGLDLREAIMAARPGGNHPEDTPPSTGGYDEVGVAYASSGKVDLTNAGGPVFHALVGLYPGFGAGGGDWLAHMHSGLSLQAMVRAGVGKRTWLTVLFRHQDAGSNENTGWSESRSIRELGLLVGGRLSRGPKPGVMGSWDLGFSSVQKRRKSEYLQFDGSTRSVSYSDGALMVVFQLGVIVPLGDRYVLDVQARAGLRPPFLGEDEPDANIITTHVGIGWISW